MTSQRNSVGAAILGAGPAGLSAAHVLARRGVPGAVFEQDGTVGGIAKTVEFNGYRFDLGGHRFHTKIKPIEQLWEEALGSEFLTRQRLSRIYYRGDFFSYPLKATDVPRRLGVGEATLCALSYIAAQFSRRRPAESFEDWVTTRFGKRLYNAFFRSYTEKVWGVPGSEIRSEWAAQRIKDFSLLRAILAILGVRRGRPTTLLDQFRYPRLGPGQMWETFQRRLDDSGFPVLLNRRCVEILHSDGQIDGIVIQTNSHEEEYGVEALLSSIPLSQLVHLLEPAAPPHVLAAAGRLRYRDFCLVALIIDQPEPFPDNWIYLHDPGIRAGRVQNFGAWSDGMVRPGTTCLGAEYFCFEGDEIWEMSDAEAVALASDELGRIGLIDPGHVVDGVKIRVPKAYPMYDAGYAEAVATIRPYLDGFVNLATFGRNGLHRYNNQDHSMWTGILAALNLVDGTSFDVWSVNTDEIYLEEGEFSDALFDSSAVVDDDRDTRTPALTDRS